MAKLFSIQLQSIFCCCCFCFSSFYSLILNFALYSTTLNQPPRRIKDDENEPNEGIQVCCWFACSLLQMTNTELWNRSHSPRARAERKTHSHFRCLQKWKEIFKLTINAKRGYSRRRSNQRNRAKIETYFVWFLNGDANVFFVNRSKCIYMCVSSFPLGFAPEKFRTEKCNRRVLVYRFNWIMMHIQLILFCMHAFCMQTFPSQDMHNK